MADTETSAKVKVEADTREATDHLIGFRKATDDVKTSARAAGAEQKAMAAEVRAGRAVIAAATGAMSEAAEAQRDAALAARAFGKDSKEAKAAQQAATVAQQAAGRAAAASAAEVKRLEVELAKVRTEANAATPAMRRLESQLDAARGAAEKQAKALNRLELEQRAAARAAADTGGGFDLLGAAGGKLMSVLGPAALAGSLMGVAGWLGTAAEKALQYQTATANLPFGIAAAQRATKGLVDEQTLLAAASQAVALKVANTSGDFEVLAAASTKLAAKLNQPADQLLGNLVTALGRGSTELLDNAGIVLKAAEAQDRYAASVGKTAAMLTADEKQSAFRIEALKAIQASADGTSVAFDGGAAAVLRWRVQFTDAMAAAQRAPIAVADAIVGVNAEAKRQVEYLRQTEEMLRVIQDPLGSLEQRMLAVADATKGANQVGLEWISTLILSEESLRKVEDAKYRARAGALQDAADRARDEQVEKARRERAAGDAAAFARDRAFREQRAKDEAAARQAGARGAKQGESAASRRAAFARDASGFDAELSTYAAKEAKRIRDEGVADQAAAFAAEEQLFQRRDERFVRELEIIEARGLAEEESQAMREDLLARRLAAEERFGQQQAAMAATDAQREQATTRLEAVEHAKRIAGLRRQSAAEQKESAARAAMFARVNGHITGLGDALVQSAWAQAEGEKGAVAASVAAYAKGVAQKMALKALEETALGVAALAGIVTAGLAAPHFAAAGLAAAAAAAAGAASAGFGAIARSQAGAGSASGGAPGFRSGGPGGAANGPTSPTAERQQLADLNKIPVSREAESRAASSSPNRQTPATLRGGDTYNVQILGGTEEQVGRALQKMIKKADNGRGRAP